MTQPERHSPFKCRYSSKFHITRKSGLPTKGAPDKICLNLGTESIEIRLLTSKTMSNKKDRTDTHTINGDSVLIISCVGSHIWAKSGQIYLAVGRTYEINSWYDGPKVDKMTIHTSKMYALRLTANKKRIYSRKRKKASSPLPLPSSPLLDLANAALQPPVQRRKTR